MDRKALRDWRRQVREVLLREWDPIAGSPKDEYDTYADQIATLIYNGANDGQLLQYLEWSETDAMGFPVFNAERAKRTIAALRALGRPGASASSA
jgi:hypothetical protein